MAKEVPMKIGTRIPRRRHEQEADPSIDVARATAAESFFQPPDLDAEPRRDEWVFLAQGTPEDWEKLVAYTEHMRFKTGETVIRSGELDRALYFVTDGRLDIMLPQPNGAERLVRTISAPAVIGEMGFVENRQRSMTIKGMTDGELLRLDYAAFERLAEDEPKIAQNLVFELARVLSLRLRWATQALACGWQ
jgi:CRP/FNR family cyclic AMP-dependent transcriptional regulator